MAIKNLPDAQKQMEDAVPREALKIQGEVAARAAGGEVVLEDTGIGERAMRAGTPEASPSEQPSAPPPPPSPSASASLDTSAGRGAGVLSGAAAELLGKREK